MPELGMTYRGKHSFRDYGMRISKLSRPVMPQVREVLEEIAGRDGSYDFSAANPALRPTYKDQDIPMECNLVEETGDFQLFRQKLRIISDWLAPHKGAGYLEFDDDPGMYYYGKFNNLVSLDQFAADGEFPLNFRCDPFVYGDEVTVSKEMTAGDNSMVISHAGLKESPCIISITGRTISTVHTVNPVLTIGSLSINFTGTLQQGVELLIDTESPSAEISGVNNIGNIAGAYDLKLQPGESIVSYSDSGCNAALVAITYRPRW